MMTVFVRWNEAATSWVITMVVRESATTLWLALKQQVPLSTLNSTIT
jgi:hypothetical protein